MKVLGFVSILLAMCIKYIECDNIQQQQPLFCNDLRPQNQVDIEQVRVFTMSFAAAFIRIKISVFFALILFTLFCNLSKLAAGDVVRQ